MKKFTRFWPLMLIMIFMTSIAFGQSVTSNDAQKAASKKAFLEQQKVEKPDGFDKATYQELDKIEKVGYTKAEKVEEVAVTYDPRGMAPVTNPAKPGPATLTSEGSTAWGFGFFGTGFMNFDVDVPTTLNSINSGASYTPFAGSYSNRSTSYMYIVDFNDGGLKMVDVATGVIVYTVGFPAIGFPGNNPAGMAVDRTTGIMYLMVLGADDLYTIDLVTGVATLVGSSGVGANIIEIAIDNSGQMYGWGLNDNAYTIDKTTGVATLIGPLGIDINYAQGGQCDPVTDIIYVAAYNNTTSQGELHTLDKVTGALTLIGLLGTGEEVDAVGFPSLSPPTVGSDMVLASVDNPVTGGNGAAELVTITVYNAGSVAESSIPVDFDFESGTTLGSGTIPGPVAPGAFASHTFATTVDASANGPYNIVACVNLVGDENTANDCLSHDFTTINCVTVNTYPYLETFDLLTNAVASCTDGTVPLVDVCWENWVDVTEGTDWDIDDLGTPSSSTGPSDDITGGGKYLFTETSSGCNNINATIISPEFDLSSLTLPQVSFYYHMYGADMGTMTAEYTTDGLTWTPFWTMTGDQGNAWYQVDMPMAALVGETSVYFRVVGNLGAGFWSDMAFDHFEVDEAPTCAVPVGLMAANITQTTADATWDNTIIPSAGWDIEWGTADYDPVGGTGTLIGSDDCHPLATPPYNITGLSPITTYSMWLRSDCGIDGVSDWVGTTFTTLGDCDWYCIGYDSYGDGWNGGSIDFIVDGVNVGNFTFTTGFGPETFYFPILDPSTLDVVWNPGAWDGEVTFDVYNHLDVIVYSDGPNPTGTTGIAADCDVPSCFNPTVIGASNITQTTADIEWTENGTAVLWEYDYGVAPYGPPAGAGTPTATTMASLAGLTDGTTYDWWVRADCGVDGYSDWVPGSFTTLYYPPANDDCANAEPVVGPYPVSVPGTTNGATLDCPGVLDWDAVWYTIDLPYDYNYVEIDLCLDDIGATLLNTGIILTADCSCDPASFIFSDGLWAVTGNCINDLNFFVEGPGTVYYPVQTDPKGDFTFDVNVTERYQVNGAFTYANTAMDPMELRTLHLDDGSKALVGTALSDLNGYFEFNNLAAGTYSLYGAAIDTLEFPWGGLSMNDVQFARQKVVNQPPGNALAGLHLAAADVDFSGGALSMNDVQFMRQRVVNAEPAFPAFWIVDSITFDVPTKGVVMQDIQGIAGGDTDGSYTPPPAPAGALCDNAIPFAFSGAPASVVNQNNCGLFNFYSETCLGLYDGGDDILYELTVTGDWTVNITLDPKGTGYSGFMIADDCPDVGTCLAFSTNSGSTPHMIEGLFLAAGTYYIMVDTWPSPTCIPDFDLSIEEWVPSYCSAGANNEDEYIVTYDVANLAAGPYLADGITYHDYTAQVADMSIATGTYPFTCVNGTPYTNDQCTVWIDWNQDLDFDDPGEVFTSTSGDWITFTGTVTVDPAALLGPTRMRVRLNYTALPEPCGSPSWGEVHDYTVNVMP